MITVYIFVAIAIAMALLLVWNNWPTGAQVVAVDRRIVEVCGEDQIELELSDGRRYRAVTGWVWYDFPSGERAPFDLERWLQKESKRLENIDHWAHADEKERRQ